MMDSSKIISKGVWVVEESVPLRSLTIAPGASLAAPAGKSLTMTINGIGTAIKPGTYKGDIFLTVADSFLMPASGLMRLGKPGEVRAAIIIDDGKYIREKSVPAMVQGGQVTDKATTGVSIYGCEDSFNGIIVTGNSEYTIDGVKIDFEGEGGNDFIGLGAGITCAGNSRVTVNNSTVKIKGVTRSVANVNHDAVVTFNNCRLSNDSPATDKMYPTWMLGFKGSNRAVMHCDNAIAYYNNCYVSSNGWGVLSVDGGLRVRIYARDSTIELTGPRARGYGSFSISDCFVSFDHCILNVQGYPLLMGNSEGICNGEITGGSVVNSTLNGVMIFRDMGSELKVNKRSIINTASSLFLVKGSNSFLNIDNAVLNPANGVILQLMDSDEPDLGAARFVPPLGEADVAILGRDLTIANPKEDVFMAVSNMEVSGDFYNSTTNLKANCRKTTKLENNTMLINMPKMDIPISLPEGTEMDMEARQGVKNLDLKFANARVKGIISAATAAYKEDVTVIDASNNQELGAITQTAHEPVNNGVIVEFDKDCIWTITGTSYLTSLTIAKGTVIKAPEGKNLTMTINGVKKAIAPGTYKGIIALVVA
jgi:hypothetical protein